MRSNEIVGGKHELRSIFLILEPFAAVKNYRKYNTYLYTFNCSFNFQWRCTVWLEYSYQMIVVVSFEVAERKKYEENSTIRKNWSKICRLDYCTSENWVLFLNSFPLVFIISSVSAQKHLNTASFLFHLCSVVCWKFFLLLLLFLFSATCQYYLLIMQTCIWHLVYICVAVNSLKIIIITRSGRDRKNNEIHSWRVWRQTAV